MEYKTIINTGNIVEQIMYKHIQEGNRVLDCTVGNGNDTILLASMVGKRGRVYGFDIQKIALEITKELLKSKGLNEQTQLIHDGHENLDKYISEKLDFIIYNLGYRPRGDKNIKTLPHTTLSSMEKALELLNNNGLLLITSYTGHQGGMDEKDAIEEFLISLDQRQYNVLKFNFINQRNNPPILYGVEKSNIRRE